MATFSGNKIQSLIGDTYVTPHLLLRPIFYNTVGFAFFQAFFTLGETVPFGTVSPKATNAASTDHEGVRIGAYGDIFYNRIIIEPSPLFIGNLVSDTTFQLTVFNAYLTASTLDSILETATEGITLVGPSRPRVLGAIQESTYTVNVSVAEGPPTINGKYTFILQALNLAVEVPLLGSRVLPLPYLFQPGLNETLTWSTNVLTTRDGTEQRMRLRNSPRQEFDFEIAIPDRNTPVLDALMYGWRSNNFGVPISSEGRLLNAATSTSSPIIECSTASADFRSASLMMLYNSPTDFELVEILSITENQVVASQNISKIFDTTTLAVPVRICQLVSDPARKTTGSKQRLKARLITIDNITLVEDGVPQYKGHDVYTIEPLAIQDYATDSYTTLVAKVDFGTGLFDTFSPWLKPKIRREFRLQFESLEEIWNHRLWLHRRAGKLRPFWMPTFESNFKLLSRDGSLVQTLFLVDEGQGSLRLGRDDVAILTTTGWLFRGVSYLIPAGQDLEMGLDTAINIPASTIVYISWLGRKRLASDRLNIQWTGNNTATSIIPIIELNN